MPLSGCRCTFFFRDDPYGFSEAHVLTTASSIAGAEGKAIALVKKRVNLLGPPARFDFARLSMEGVFRDSQVFTANDWSIPLPPIYTMSGAGVPDEPNDADQGKSCIQLRMEATTTARKSLYLAGIPDPIIGTDPEGPRSIQYAQWFKYFNSWRNELVSNGWGFRARTPATGAYARIPVVGLVAQAGTSFIGLVCPNNVLTFAVGQEVQTTNFKMSNRAYFPLNGKWQISAITTNSPVAGQNTYFLLGSAGVPIDQVAINGTVQLIDFSDVAYTNVQIWKQTTRKRGNRFIVPPGRRSTRRYISA